MNRRPNIPKRELIVDIRLEALLETTAFYRSLEEISQLETELKKTIQRHGELIRETTHLQDVADKMIHQAKLRKLRNVFDFQGCLKKLEQADNPAGMIYILAPLFAPKLNKSFALKNIDNMLTYKSDNPEQGEIVRNEQTDYDFRYQDEAEEQRIAHNFGRIFYELLDQLDKKETIELKEWNAILEIKYGEDFLKNGDYYSFMVHIAQKTSYSMKQLYEKPETFLENVILEEWSETERERFRDMDISLTFLEQEEIRIQQGDTEFTMTNILFSK